MKYFPTLSILVLIFLLSACQPVAPACPPGSISYLSNSTSLQNPTASGNPKAAAETLEINGQEMLVDQVVKGTLCNDSWKGTIYVPCEIQIYEWEEDPTFLQKCDLIIEPGTVVYVAAHNNTPYYQGCSCHTGEVEE
jgi:hypothetical protein